MIGKRPALQFSGRIARQNLRAVVGIKQSAVLGDENGIVGVLHQNAIFLLREPQDFFRLFTFGNVPAFGNQQRDLSAIIEDRLEREVHDALDPVMTDVR